MKPKPGEIHVWHPRDVHVSNIMMALIGKVSLSEESHRLLETDIARCVDQAMYAGYHSFECAEYLRGRRDGIKAGMERRESSSRFNYENRRENV
jgi:hypothetical protein